MEEEARDLGIQALTEAWEAQDIHRLNGAFSLCVALGCVDDEMRAWYVRAWRNLVKVYEAEGRSWTRRQWKPTGVAMTRP